MASVSQKRFLNLQEYQSKKLMARYGINIQRFEVAETVQEAVDSAHYLSKSILLALLFVNV